MKVVEIDNPVDIVKMLRHAADRVEQGEFPDLQFVVAVFVDHDGSFITYGWGQMSALEGFGALARAVHSDPPDINS